MHLLQMVKLFPFPYFFARLLLRFFVPFFYTYFFLLSTVLFTLFLLLFSVFFFLLFFSFFLYFCKAFTRTKGFLVIWLRLEKQLERVPSLSALMKGICGCCCCCGCCRRRCCCCCCFLATLHFYFTAGFGGLAQAAFVLKRKGVKECRE